MKICIPTIKDEGIDSVAYGHFNSAPKFIMYDLATKELYCIANENRFATKGNPTTIDLLFEHSVNALVVGGLCHKAFENLHKMNIKVYRSTDFFHVYEIIDQFSKDLMFELHPQDCYDAD
ncbi:hypothetical protein MASR1M45_05130 [Candidatus Kapaibacterium sp.]